MGTIPPTRIAPIPKPPKVYDITSEYCGRIYSQYVPQSCTGCGAPLRKIPHGSNRTD